MMQPIFKDRADFLSKVTGNHYKPFNSETERYVNSVKTTQSVDPDFFIFEYPMAHNRRGIKNIEIGNLRDILECSSVMRALSFIDGVVNACGGWEFTEEDFDKLLQFFRDKTSAIHPNEYIQLYHRLNKNPIISAYNTFDQLTSNVDIVVVSNKVTRKFNRNTIRISKEAFTEKYLKDSNYKLELNLPLLTEEPFDLTTPSIYLNLRINVGKPSTYINHLLTLHPELKDAKFEMDGRTASQYPHRFNLLCTQFNGAYNYDSLSNHYSTNGSTTIFILVDPQSGEVTDTIYSVEAVNDYLRDHVLDTRRDKRAVPASINEKMGDLLVDDPAFLQIGNDLPLSEEEEDRIEAIIRGQHLRMSNYAWEHGEF